LWIDDPRLPMPLLEALRRDPALVVGDNEPYSSRDPSEYTLSAHAKPRGIPYCSIEVRQDLIATADSARAWAHRLAVPIREAVALGIA
jgi:predicted N-formylglutamate amidohydrolase